MPNLNEGQVTDGSELYSAPTEVDSTQAPVTTEPSQPSSQPAAATQAPAATDGKPAASQPAATAAPKAKEESEEERIARVVATVQKVTAPKKEQEKQPELTPEQLDALLKPVKVTPDLMKSLGFENATPEQIAGFQAFAQAIVQNSFAMSNLAIEQRMRAAYNEFSPVAQFYQQQQAEQQRASFFKAYPNLQKHERLVGLAAQRISPTRADGSEKSVDDVMKEINDEVTTILTSAGVELTAAPAGDTTQASKGGVPKLESLTQPGQSLSKGGGGDGKPNNPDADIYS